MRSVRRGQRSRLLGATGLALGLAASLGLGSAEGQEQAPPPWGGWEAEALRRTPHPETPVDLPREAEGAFQSRLADLIAGEKWEAVAAQLVSRARNRSLQGRVLDRAGSLPRGVAPSAIDQLRRWPLARRAAASAAREELNELLRAPQDVRAARIEALNRYPFADQAGALAGRLGDEALEAGRCEEAAAWWRRAKGLAGTADFAARAERRLLWLRARVSEGATITGRLGPTPSVGAPRLRWLRKLGGAVTARPPRRLLASDGEALYTSSQGRLVSLARADGRVRWEVPAPGVGSAVLGVGGRELVVGRRKELRAFSTSTGEVLWTAVLELEEISDLQPWGEGWVALGVRDGHWRCLGLGARGVTRWATRLWEYEVPSLRPIQRGVPGRAIPAGAVRSVRGDGRLSLLADSCAVTAAGRVAVLGAFQGELRWARQRLFGLGLGEPGPVDVSVHLGAFELWAMTAAGLLVRLEPASGASLPLPAVPLGSKGPQRGYLVSAAPPIWIWRDGRFGGVDQAPSGALEEGPLWSGAWAQGWLALPRGAGLELRRGSERQQLPWPNRPGQIRSLGDAWVVIDPEGIALLDWSLPGLEASPAPAKAPQDPARLLRALGHPSWRVRQAARAGLSLEAARSLRVALPKARLSAAARLEVGFVLGEIFAREDRRNRWAKIAPGVSLSKIEAAYADVSGRALRALVAAVKSDPAAAGALKAELSSLQSWGQRLAFLELFLKADPRFEGRLVALCGAGGSGAGVQQAAAELLVQAARRGGSKRGLRLLIRRRSVHMIRALAQTGDQKLWEEVAPEDLKGLKLQQIGPSLFGTGSERDLPGLWEALGPVLRAP